MSRSTRRMRRGTALVAGALAAAVAVPAVAQAQISQGPRAYAATANKKLLTFPLSNPLFAQSRSITGLASGDTIVGIDERPLSGALYAVTKGNGGVARAYTINPATGQATLAFNLVMAGTTTPIVLSGTEFGVDFNPVADALRIVSNSGQNLRAFPSTRPMAVPPRVIGDTVTDGPLSYVATGVSPRPVEQGVNSAAYTNNDADPATTTTALYDIDAVTQRDLVLQSPPNDGTLTTPVDLDLGARQVQGFDIRGASDAYVLLGGVRFGSAFEAFLNARQIVPSRVPVRLYGLNIATGALEERGLVGTSSPAVGFTIDIPTP